MFLPSVRHFGMEIYAANIVALKVAFQLSTTNTRAEAIFTKKEANCLLVGAFSNKLTMDFLCFIVGRIGQLLGSQFFSLHKTVSEHLKIPEIFSGNLSVDD